VVDEASGLLPADTSWAVEVGVGVVGEDLSQSSIEVQRVIRRDAIDGLREKKNTDGWDSTDQLNSTHPLFSPSRTDALPSVQSAPRIY
jgi:hypothetical protein